MQITVTSSAKSGHSNFREALPSEAVIAYSGNSGTDPVFQTGFQALVESGGKTVVVRQSTMPGSPIHYRIPTSVTGLSIETENTAWDNIADYDVLHITDNSSMGGIGALTNQNNTYIDMWTERFVTAAKPDAEFIIWIPQTPWKRVSPTWSEADYEAGLPQAAAWDRFVLWFERVNSMLPPSRKPARLIPGNRLIDKFRADYVAGAGPTPTWFTDLFAPGDDFHFRNDVTGVSQSIGVYAVRILNYCALYGIDPMTLDDYAGRPTPLPDAASGPYIRAKTRETLIEYASYVGLDTSAWVS